MNRIPIDFDAYSEEELLRMSKKEATQGLTEKQMKFCEFYIEGHNRKLAMQKAGFGEIASATYAYRLLRNENVARYVCWLKAKVLREHFITAYDVLDEWIRIAFSDMTDFVEIRPHSISLKPATEIDGQLVKSIKSGRDGISIELHDKMRALDNLARYIDDMPSDWKQKIEERRAEILEQEFELKKKMYEIENPDQKDDGFVEAIKNATKAIWSNE